MELHNSEFGVGWGECGTREELKRWRSCSLGRGEIWRADEEGKGRDGDCLLRDLNSKWQNAATFLNPD